MNLWPGEHFFPHFLAGSVLISADPAKKWGKKWSPGQRFICTEVTSYKIHILVSSQILNGSQDFFFSLVPVLYTIGL